MDKARELMLRCNEAYYKGIKAYADAYLPGENPDARPFPRNLAPSADQYGWMCVYEVLKEAEEKG